MTEREDSSYYDKDQLKEHIDLHHARIESGRPSSDQISFAMKFMLPDLKQSIIEKFNSEEYSLEGIKKLKQEHEEYAGKSISRIALCTGIIANCLGDEVWSLARNAFRANNIADFNFYFDFFNGASIIVNGLSDADEENRGQYEEFLAEVVLDPNVDSNVDMSEKVDLYLMEKKIVNENLKLLKDDSSGFSLADRLMTDIEKIYPRKVLDPDRNPIEYVSAGAQLVADCYKKLYQLVEPLYPDSQSNSPQK
jgi:hypothetical protein